ncbi:MAG: ROK family glucokinase [Streptomycetales bacterium]
MSHAGSHLTIGVDIGGTKVAGGVVDEAGLVLERLRADTPSTSRREIQHAIVGVANELASRHPARAVGVGAAGFVDASRSSVLFAPHLAWRHEPLREAIQELIRLPVVVENDANAAAWAEYRFGAGRGEPDLVCVTLGTGIGGGVVTDGVLRRGRYGVAGEFGHMCLVPGGHRCECGNRGCWEQYASGNAIVRESREVLASGSPLAQGFLERVGGRPEALTGADVTGAARNGDAVAVEIMEEVGRWLGIGLANLAAAYDPGCLVVGGGVADAGEMLLAPARHAFRRQLTGRGYRPEARIVQAALGNDAGLVGAADLARDVALRFATRRRRRKRPGGLSSRRG